MSYLLLQYFEWHFWGRPKVMLEAWRNLLVFVINFFSIPQLIKTLFAPLHRYSESYGRGFDIGRWVQAALSNVIFRSLGALVRSVFIVLGSLFFLLVLLLGGVFIALWLIFPLLIAFLVILGARLLW